MEDFFKSFILHTVSYLTGSFLCSFLILTYMRSDYNSDNRCDDGWEPYKQEKCLKLFDTAGLLNYANAENICKEQNDSFLISIDGAEKQEFVQTFLRSHSVVDKVWIGLTYENNILQWADGTQLRYSNWANGSPKNDISYCFQMETEAANFGLWSDEWCGEKNLVLCERFQHWSSAQLQIKMVNLMRNSVQQRLVSDSQLSSSTNSVRNLNSTLTHVQTSLTSSISSLTNKGQNMNSALTELKTNLTNSISSLTNSIHYLNSTLTHVQTSLTSSISSLTNKGQNMNSALTELKTNLTNAMSNSTNSIHYLNSTLTQLQTGLKSSVSSLTNTEQNMNSALIQLQTNLANSISSSTYSIQRLNLSLTQSTMSVTQMIRNNLLPVGFIYVQLPKEKSPTETWPWMKWKDISSEYAGLFFRTVGGNAATFGQIQTADSPRLISLIEAKADGQEFNEINVLANNEYSQILDIDGSSTDTKWGIRVKVSNGEVRPVNMAIRIWKRIG